MSTKLNPDQATRDTLIFGEPIPEEEYSGGIKRFSGVSLDTLEALLAQNFADPDETQNDSPTISEFYEFLGNYPQCTVHGYVVSNTRDDYRVSIEGAECEYDVNSKLITAFVELFRFADEFTCEPNYLFCWYD